MVCALRRKNPHLKSGTGLAQSSRRASSWSVWFDQRWRSRSGSSGL